MRKIREKFKELKEINKKALITFVTAGDPNIEVNKKIVKEMENRGADIIELGIPYSDPIAEGPVIQRANVRALGNNIRIKDIFDEVNSLRKDYSVKVPLLYLLYYNVIFQYGLDEFFKECERVDLNGVIIPDVPYEESGEVIDFAEKYNIDLITLVSPTSKERIENIAKNAKGFLYCVSSLGVTGARSSFDTDFEEFFGYINKCTTVPKALGFGISTTDHIRELKGYCDGLIVGTAIVKKVEESKSDDEAIENVGKYIEELRNAMDE